MQQQISTPIKLRIDQIQLMPEGFNPRGYFDTKALNELVESIREHGVVTAITVRPAGEGMYQLIAGERRFRASGQAGLTEIPAVVRDVDDVTARRLAMVENLHRRDISLAEEAMAARLIVDECDGDRAEAARTLGWEPDKLSHRLMLLHASKAVLDALTRKEIKLGHVELLATIPAEKQDAALPKIIEHKLTIQQVREQVLGISLPLAKAKFDLAGCARCPHNSDVQSSLFESNLGSGRCSNAPCFNAKTAAWVETRKAELKEEFGSVALITEKEPGTTVPLLVTGDTGVGQEQFNACKGCKHYGAILDNRIGPTLGAVAAPTCFSVECNKEKQQAYRDSLNPQQSADDEDDGADGDDGSEAQSGQTPAAGAASRQSKAKKKNKAKAKATVHATSGAVVEQYDRVLRDTVIQQLAAGAVEPILALATYGLASVAASATGATVGTILAEVGEAETHSYAHAGTVLALASRDKADLQRKLQQLAGLLFSHKPDHASHRDEKVNRRQLAAGLVQQRGWDVLPHVRVDKSFLESHTKAGIEAVLEESGFKADYEAREDGAKKYRALLAMGKKDLIDGVLAAGYDFSAWTPCGLLDHAASLVKAIK